MSLDQRRARVFGVLYLGTFVTSIPAALLYRPALDHPVSYIARGGHDKQILLGALLELLLIVANIGTAVVIFPIVRRYNEELALGYVAARTVESTFILVGVVAMVAIITLHQQVAGKDWTFLLGPGWVVGCDRGQRVGHGSFRRPGGFRRAAPILSGTQTAPQPIGA